MPKTYEEDGKTIVRYTLEEARKLPRLTDGSRADAMTDEELTANALSDPDNPPLPDDFFEKAKRMRLEDLLPETKERVCIRLALLPDGMIDQIHLEADAERLIAAAFGEEG